MKLIVKCPKCKQETNAPHHVNNRIDYAKQYGDNFTLRCENCNQSSEYHVDDIKAEDYSFMEIIKNRLIVFAIIFVIALILGIFIIGPGLGIILSIISVFISITLVKKNSSENNLIFNKHKLKGRVSGIEFKK